MTWRSAGGEFFLVNEADGAAEAKQVDYLSMLLSQKYATIAGT